MNGSAWPSWFFALSCAATRRCLASLSSGNAPIWIIQPLLRGLAAGCGIAATGTLSPAEAILPGGPPGFAPGGGDGGSRFAMATVVTLVGLAVAGAGMSLGLSDDSADSDAVCVALTCTVNVFTGLGLIGSVEPNAGSAWRGTGAAATTFSLTSLASLLSMTRASAVSQPSTTGGAVRLTAAILMLLSIRLRTSASRALAVRPPNTTATR